jgi:hypothetical protein
LEARSPTFSPAALDRTLFATYLHHCCCFTTTSTTVLLHLLRLRHSFALLPVTLRGAMGLS